MVTNKDYENDHKTNPVSVKVWKSGDNLVKITDARVATGIVTINRNVAVMDFKKTYCDPDYSTNNQVFWYCTPCPER